MIQVYTAMAARQILGRKDIVKVEEWSNCAWVKFTKGSQFVSKKKFQEFFASSRKQRAIKLEVSHYGHELFQVESQSQEHSYLISIKEKPECECKDFRNQVESGQVKHSLCKHIWATLKTLGFENFSEYVQNKGWKKCEVM
jgi:hypothetical protein